MSWILEHFVRNQDTAAVQQYVRHTAAAVVVVRKVICTIRVVHTACTVCVSVHRSIPIPRRNSGAVGYSYFQLFNFWEHTRIQIRKWALWVGINNKYSYEESSELVLSGALFFEIQIKQHEKIQARHRQDSRVGVSRVHEKNKNDTTLRKRLKSK